MNTIRPSKNEFLDFIRMGTILPVYTEIDAPGLTPLMALETLRADRYSVLLESAKVNKKTGRYSFVTADPYLIFKSDGDEVDLNLPAIPAGKYGKRATIKRKPLVKLRELLSNYRTGRVEGLPPFLGGAVGFFSYDFVHQFEKLPRTTNTDLKIPESYFIFVDMVVAFDHILNKVWVIVNPGAREQELGFRRPDPDQWARHYDEAVNKLMVYTEKLATDHVKGDLPVSGKDAHQRINLVPNLTQTEFNSMVWKCKEYIAAGDINQANLSLRFSTAIGNQDPFRLYELLRKVTPSPFAAYLDFGDLQIVSFSPERLIRLSDRVADTRPITSTRRRENNSEETMAFSVERLTDDKKRMEHIMLFNLERNDLGKVCDYGSVAVDEMMVAETYSHVIHIASNIRGILAQNKDCFDLVRAMFPGGTITGVPKMRCMEIIDELEPTARGPFTGSIGYISNSGDMDFNIIISTFVIKDRKAYFQVEAGIVSDSYPEREYIETLQKVEALQKVFALL